MRILLLLPLAFLLTSCVTDSEGNSRVDWDGVNKGVTEGIRLYDRYNATPQPYQQPVYYVQPVYP